MKVMYCFFVFCFLFFWRPSKVLTLNKNKNQAVSVKKHKLTAVLRYA